MLAVIMNLEYLIGSKYGRGAVDHTAKINALM
jgi:hypothetical protein